MEALLVIDVQKAFNHQSFGRRNNESEEKNMESIIEFFRNQKKKLFIFSM